MTEAIRQLTDDAGERAVPDAKLGLVSGSAWSRTTGACAPAR